MPSMTSYSEQDSIDFLRESIKRGEKVFASDAIVLLRVYDRLLPLLKECQAFLFDDSGTPIAPEDLRERVNDALIA